ncbi:hypothetical protein [Planctomonas sp. JC2975]
MPDTLEVEVVADDSARGVTPDDACSGAAGADAPPVTDPASGALALESF